MIELRPEHTRRDQSENLRIGTILVLIAATPSSVDTTEDGDYSGIKYRVYSPSKDVALPIVIWAHGGLMIGDLDTDDHLSRIVAERAACILDSVDYRLSPRHKVQAHLEDVLAMCHRVPALVMSVLLS